MTLTNLGNYAVLPKTSNICQTYDNPKIIKQSVPEYVPNDDAQIQAIRIRLAELEEKKEWVTVTFTTTYYSTCRDWYDANWDNLAGRVVKCVEVTGGLQLTSGRWVYPPEYNTLSAQLDALTPGTNIYKEVDIQNPSYDPYWLASNRRIFFLGGDGFPDLKWEHTDRNFIGFNKNQEIEAIFTIGNFISSVSYYRFCSDSDPVCKNEYGTHTGWYAEVTYSCDGESSPDPIDNYSSGYDSGDNGNSNCTGRCGNCEVNLGGGDDTCCCLDTKLMRYIFKNVFN